MKQERLHKIGFVAETLNVSLRTIRYYEELGLIHPFRTEKGTRLYSDEDVARLGMALVLREYGLSLEQVTELATCRKKFDTGRESSRFILPILKTLQIDIAEKIESYQTLSREVERAIQLIRKCEHCSRPPTNKGCPNCPVALNKQDSGVAALIWEADNG
ncbi:MAG: MerR family transcriptional regulator [Gammaproteobacteria bacterium]